MKQFAKLNFTAAAVLAALVLSGCATSQPKKQAAICPDCKMVKVTVADIGWGAEVPIAEDGHETTFGANNSFPGDYTTTYLQHRCPYCQGAVKTFFKEGKLRHYCSTCDKMAAVCPKDHRW